MEIITQLDISGDKKLNKQEFIAGYEKIHSNNFHSILFFLIRCKNDPVIRRILAPNI